MDSTSNKNTKIRQDIRTNIEQIAEAIAWSEKYGKDTFPVEELKEYRRQLRRIYTALQSNSSAAAYGESQVGKSYLMSSLLSTSTQPFVIPFEGRDYSFIDEINPSGGANSKEESTGVITRFTIEPANAKLADMVRIDLLTVADIVMLLIDSYYNDLRIDANTAIRYDEINTELKNLQHIWAGKTTPVQTALTEDDIKDICDYAVDTLGAATVKQSDFAKIVAPVIDKVAPENWSKIFSLLWNRNANFTRLFNLLINEYAKLGFESEVYVPYRAVLRRHGTLLKIEWLNAICGDVASGTEQDEQYTDVYDANGRLLYENFGKTYLSALIAELTFHVSPALAQERKFLRKIDLLDFPGARARERYNEQEIDTVLPTVLRRGKVAYLFNKYSRSLRISSVLFCHHNDMKNGPSVGPTITEWIKENVGATPAERAEYLRITNCISPMFMVATKFNIELQRNDKTDFASSPERLTDHWKRFKNILPEIIKPATWYEQWVTPNDLFSSDAFRSIYLLRDFYWSAKNNIYEGYSDGRNSPASPEERLHIHSDYPTYMDDLRRSFVENEDVCRHFANPAQAWEEAATLNNDGTKPIIRDLDSISDVLDDARHSRYLKQVQQINNEILAKLQAYYEPDNDEENNERIRRIIGAIRRTLVQNIGARPETFGFVIDQLMVPAGELRKIAYDIVVLRTETPRDFNEIIMIRNMAGYDASASREENIERLCDFYACSTRAELEDMLKTMGFDLEQMLAVETDVAATVSNVVSNAIIRHWTAFINRQVKALDKLIPYPDEVAFMLQTLCKKLGVQRVISDKIKVYSDIFPPQDVYIAIADFASLTLNNFVSTVGNEYMTADDIHAISEKAVLCNIRVDTAKVSSTPVRRDIPLMDALRAFDDAANPSVVSVATLMKLPFWDNFQRWLELMAAGLLYSSDVSHCDPEANKAMKKIIDQSNELYR